MFHWRRIGRRTEFEITPAAYAATRSENALTDFFYFLGKIRFEIRDPCADGNLQDKILTFAAVEELSAAVAAALPLHFLAARQDHERVDVARTLEIDAPPVTAV